MSADDAAREATIELEERVAGLADDLGRWTQRAQSKAAALDELEIQLASLSV